VKDNTVDLILLDLMLPGKDGLDICRELRVFSTLPIIITTARVEEIDRLLGLELGADDYICKPYSPREVVARVKAQLRRADYIKNNQRSPHDSLLTLDADRLCVVTADSDIQLTAVEFALLKILHQSPGRIYNRDQLMDRIYNDQRIVSYRTIDSHVKKLRLKLSQLIPDRELIHSVYAVGYRYEVG
jgi:two-component system response regulator BaeR